MNTIIIKSFFMGKLDKLGYKVQTLFSLVETYPDINFNEIIKKRKKEESIKNSEFYNNERIKTILCFFKGHKNNVRLFSINKILKIDNALCEKYLEDLVNEGKINRIPHKFIYKNSSIAKRERFYGNYYYSRRD